MKSTAVLNWFDLLVLVTLCVGVLRGRKRGMSEELLDFFQWLAIIGVGAFLYPHLSQAIITAANFSLLAANISAYALIAVLIKLGFTAMKRAVGEKLVQSDTFGNFEYYLGMVAGAVRFLCILLFTINFLHAKYISDAERAATAKMQADNFGSISFPTIGSLQHAIFYESYSGKFMREKIKVLLLKPASGGKQSGENIYKRRERAVDEILK